MLVQLRLDINGEAREIAVGRGATLLNVLRNEIGLFGAHYGCGRGICGACFVLVNGEATASCTLAAEECMGKTIVTVEGLARDGKLHPVQRAFVQEDAMQCGACTSGMVISAVALLSRERLPNDVQIRAALTPHLCRCGVYLRAIRAIKQASQ